MAQESAKTCIIDWYATTKKGTVYDWPAPPSYFLAQETVPVWGPVRSMRLGVYRDGKRAFDVNQHDWGVKLRFDSGCEGQLWLQMQFYDPVGAPASDHEYVIHANIEFGVPTAGSEREYDPLDASNQSLARST